MPRIAILGGGLCGRLTALQLAEQGLSVALFDKGGRKGENAAAYVAAAMLAPADDLAVEFAGKVKVVKINIDDNQATPAQFGVRSIPTLLLFKDGKPVATQVGALPKNQLAAFINQNI